MNGVSLMPDGPTSVCSTWLVATASDEVLRVAPMRTRRPTCTPAFPAQARHRTLAWYQLPDSSVMPVMAARLVTCTSEVPVWLNWELVCDSPTMRGSLSAEMLAVVATVFQEPDW